MLDKQIESLIKNKALFVVNHSGGKDSQAMMIYLKELIPQQQLLVIHATLGIVEWPGTIEHIKNTIDDLPLIIAENTNKNFFDMVEHRQMWPSPKNRQCTSDLKRGPIEREIRTYLKNNKQFEGKIVNCMGLRAEESLRRSKAIAFKKNERNSKAGRNWFDWLPIHKHKIEKVFETIRKANQKPHWAYEKGMTRLSCSFCIMASKKDLKTAAKLRPDLFQKYCDYEKKLGMTFIMPTKNKKIFLKDL